MFVRLYVEIIQGLELSYVQVDKHGIAISYHLHQCEIVCAKVDKGGINCFIDN